MSKTFSKTLPQQSNSSHNRQLCKPVNMKILICLCMFILGHVDAAVQSSQNRGGSSTTNQKNLLSDYQPTGCIGLRFKKTLIQQEDLTYIIYPSLIQEIYVRKIQQLNNFVVNDEDYNSDDKSFSEKKDDKHINKQNTYELPTDQIVKLEIEQMIESLLQEMARAHIESNYQILQALLPKERLQSIQKLSDISYTLDEMPSITNLMPDYSPKNLKKLKPQHKIVKMFANDIEVLPLFGRVDFGSQEILIGRKKEIMIKNININKKELVIDQILTSTMELEIFVPGEMGRKLQAPFTIQANQTLQIIVVLIPQTLGAFEGYVQLLIDENIIVLPVSAHIKENQYKILPLYFTDVYTTEKIDHPLNITNNQQHEMLIIKEMFTTDSQLRLKWPNGNFINSRTDIHNQSSEQYSSFLKIPYSANGNKHFATLSFNFDSPGEYQGYIHITNSFADVMRVPVYVHVNSDKFRFYPSVIDFGVVSQNFYPLALNIKAKLRTNEVQEIKDIMVPIYDGRIQYHLKGLSVNQAFATNKLKKNIEYDLISVILNPNKPGMIDSKIIITAILHSNKTIQIQIPIIGKIVANYTLFKGELPSYYKYPSPLVAFDLTKNIATYLPSMKPVFNLNHLYLYLTILNTFDKPLMMQGIVNYNQEVNINSISQYKHILDSQDTVQLAGVQLQLNLLPLAHGQYFISLIANYTLFPVFISVYERSLTCYWELDCEVKSCSAPHDINFQSMAVDNAKSIRLNITNRNPIDITIDQIQKQSIDDLNVYVEKIYDRDGQVVQQSGGADNENRLQIALVTNKKSMKQVNLTLMPYHSFGLVFQIQAKEQKVQSSKIDFLVKDKISPNFFFSYQYQILVGQLTFMPQNIRFSPGFPGIVQVRQLAVKSTFDIMVKVISIQCNDKRIKIDYENKIYPRNKTELANLTFDPSLRATNNQIKIPQLFHLLPNLTREQVSAVKEFLANEPQNQKGVQDLIQGFFQQTHSQLNIIDLKNWQDKQKQWDRLNQYGKSEINTFLTVETNIIQRVEVPVKAYLTKPQLIQEDSINFGYEQIGGKQVKDLTILNPSDETLVVQLFIAYEEDLKLENLLKEQTDLNQIEDFIQKQNEQIYDFNRSSLFQDYLDRLCSQFNFNQSWAIENEDILIPHQFDNQTLCAYLSSLSKIDKNSPQELKDQKVQAENFIRKIHLQSMGVNINQAQGISQYQFSMNGENNSPKHVVQQNNAVGGKQQQYSNNNASSQQQSNQQQFKYHQQELEELIRNILKISQNKPIDKQFKKLVNELGLSKDDADYSQPFEQIIEKKESILDQIFDHIRKFFDDKSQKYRSKAQTMTLKPYYLKNEIYNQLIYGNQSSTFPLKEEDLLAIQNSHQQFYINPKQFGKTITIPPLQNYTIEQALIFSPSNILNPNLSMKLLIKNNLTAIEPVDLKGSGGTGFIEFVKVFKHSFGGDNIELEKDIEETSFSESTAHYGTVRDLNETSTREKILQGIYGDFKQTSSSGNDTKKNDYYHKNKSVLSNKIMTFQVKKDDIILQDPLDPHSMRIQPLHQRIFIAKNIGNLPITIESLSISGQPCENSGIKIENCRPFTLQPGRTHQISISFETDFSMAQIRKILTLESKYFIQEFYIQIIIPLSVLSQLHQLAPLSTTEETLYLPLKMLIFGIGLMGIYFALKEVQNHRYFRRRYIHKVLQKQRDNLNKPQEALLNVVHSNQVKTLTPFSTKELPIIKEFLGSGQMMNVYQQAQEKFDHPSQQLLKEIVNICQKKNLVMFECQKSAIDLENQRRHNNRLNIMRYFEMKDKEKQVQEQKEKEKDKIKDYAGSRQDSQNENTQYQLSIPKRSSQQQQDTDKEKTDQSISDSQIENTKQSKQSSSQKEEIQKSQSKKSVDDSKSSINQDDQSKDSLEQKNIQQKDIKKKPINKINKKQQKEILARQKENELYKKMHEEKERQRIIDEQNQEQLRIQREKEEERMRIADNLRREEEERILEERRQLLLEQEKNEPPSPSISDSKILAKDSDDANQGNSFLRKENSLESQESSQEITIKKSNQDEQDLSMNMSVPSQLSQKSENIKPYHDKLGKEKNESETLAPEINISSSKKDSAKKQEKQGVETIPSKIQQPQPAPSNVYSYQQNLKQGSGQQTQPQQNLTIQQQKRNYQYQQYQQQQQQQAFTYQRKNQRDQQQQQHQQQQYYKNQMQLQQLQQQQFASTQLGYQANKRGGAQAYQSNYWAQQNTYYQKRGSGTASAAAGSHGYYGGTGQRTNYYDSFKQNTIQGGVDYPAEDDPYYEKRYSLNQQQYPSSQPSGYTGTGRTVVNILKNNPASSQQQYFQKQSGRKIQGQNSGTFKEEEEQNYPFYQDNKRKFYGKKQFGTEEDLIEDQYNFEEYKKGEDDYLENKDAIGDDYDENEKEEFDGDGSYSIEGRDVTYGSFLQDLEDEGKEVKRFDSSTAKREDKLSKDDLEPFFESNKKQSERKVSPLKEEPLSKFNLNMPLQRNDNQSDLGESLFQMNFLSGRMTQQQKNQQSQEEDELDKFDSRRYLPDFINDEQTEALNQPKFSLQQNQQQNQQQQQQQQQQTNTNFFAAFQTAKTIFNKNTTLFGQNLEHYEMEEQNNEKDNESENSESAGFSLFSGNLFGSSSIFPQRKTPFGGFAVHDPRLDENEGVATSSTLSELRQGSQPVETYSLFGNMSYTPQYPDQKDQQSKNQR